MTGLLMLTVCVPVLLAALTPQHRGPRRDVQPPWWQVTGRRDWDRRLAEDDEVAALDALWDLPTVPDRWA